MLLNEMQKQRVQTAQTMDEQAAKIHGLEQQVAAMSAALQKLLPRDATASPQ